MTDEPINPRKEEADAIAAIGRTPDGRLLHRYLRRVLEGVIDFPDPSALNNSNGRRSLARDLMRQMAEGIDDHRDTSSADAPILARSGGPAAVVGRARRDPARFPRVDSFGDARAPDGSEPGGSGNPPG